MDFIPALPTYGSDYAAKNVWSWFEALLRDFDGIAYYKHPIIGSSSGSQPDFTIIAQPFQPMVVTCIRYRIEDIVAVSEEQWSVIEGGNTKEIDSPLLEMDDFVVGLQQRFDRERGIRRKLNVCPVFALPLISAREFQQKFGLEIPNSIRRTEDVRDQLKRHSEDLSEIQWKLAKSVMQSATPLNRQIGIRPKAARRLGDAIRILESDIANLDL